ncbi:MAG TPA: hypothetical protein VII71_06225, partial [Verrucomicrobiae bacterium]
DGEAADIPVAVVFQAAAADFLEEDFPVVAVVAAAAGQGDHGDYASKKIHTTIATRPARGGDPRGGTKNLGPNPRSDQP